MPRKYKQSVSKTDGCVYIKIHYEYCIMCPSCSLLVAHTNNHKHMPVNGTLKLIVVYTFENKLDMCPNCGTKTEFCLTTSDLYKKICKHELNTKKFKEEDRDLI